MDESGCPSARKRQAVTGATRVQSSSPARKRRNTTGATTTAALDRMITMYPDFQKTAQSVLLGVLECKVCHTSIVANPFRLQEHLDTKKHKRVVETTQKIDSWLGKAPSPDSARNEALTRLVGNIASLNIPIAEIPRIFSPENMALMNHIGSVPSRETVRSTFLLRAYEQAFARVRSLVHGSWFSVLVDESEDIHHTPIWCMFINVPGACVLGHVVVAESQATNGADALVKFVNDAISACDLDAQQMLALATDNAPYCGKGFRLLKAAHPQLRWIRCIAHGLNIVIRAFCGPLVRVDQFVADCKSFFVKGNGLGKRIAAFTSHFGRSALSVFDVTETRWSEWLHAVRWTSANAEEFGRWMSSEKSASETSNRIRQFLSETACLAQLHIASGCTSELLELIVAAQGATIDFLHGTQDKAKGNCFDRLEGQFAFLKNLETDGSFAEQFLLAVFSSIKGKPKTDQTNQDPLAFDVKFRQMSPEQQGECVILCRQGALVAAEKYEKHLKDTVSSLRLGRYLDPMLAAREIDSLRAQPLPPPEILQSGLCQVNASLLSDWRLYVSKLLPCYIDKPGDHRPSAVEFWRGWALQEVPTLADCALKFLALPLGTAAVERAFSKLRDVQAPHRCNIGDEYLKMELSLSFNSGVLQRVSPL